MLDDESDAPESAIALVGDMKILIPMAGLIDKDAELKRLDKEIGKLRGDIERIEKKLANPSFVDKAPAAVVAEGARPPHRARRRAGQLVAQQTMILNDCFDLARDREIHPDRPLPSGRIGTRSAWAAGFGLLGLGMLLGVVAGPGPLLLTLLLAGVILAYVSGLKHRAPGPAFLALARWLNWLLGLSAGLVLIPELLLALPVLLYTLSLAVLHRAGLAPSRRMVRRAVVPLALALGATLGLYALGILTDPYALALTAVGGALLLRRLLRLMDDPTRARVRACVGFMLLCMIPLDALLLAGDGQRLAAVLLLLLLPPIWLLGYRVPPS
jgi:hypothetical protein